MFSQSSLTFLETTIFIGQITDLHFLGVGYWKIIVFLSWSHVSLVYHIFGRLVFSVFVFGEAVTSSNLY